MSGENEERRAVEALAQETQSMTSKAQPIPVGADPRQIEAAKTSRLRALRLAKEAEDREAAARAAAATPSKPVRRRVRAAAAHENGSGKDSARS